MNVLNALAYASTTELPLNTYAVVTFTGSNLLPAGSPPTARQTSACQARVIAIYGDYARACGFQPTHLWVLEQVTGKGLHLNLLAHLPRQDHEAHRLALQRALETGFGFPHTTTGTHRPVYVEPGYLAPSSAFIRAHYALKGIAPSVESYARIGRDAGPSRQGTIFGKRLGTSKNLAPGARRQAGYADTATQADLEASRWLRRHVESVIVLTLRRIGFSHLRLTEDLDHHARPACRPDRGIGDGRAARPRQRRRPDAGPSLPRPYRDGPDRRRGAARPAGVTPRPAARATGPPPPQDTPGRLISGRPEAPPFLKQGSPAQAISGS